MKIMSAPPRLDSAESIRDQYEALRKLAMVQVGPPRNPNKPLTSFSISDILGGNNNTATRRQVQRNLNNNTVRSIVRPWDSRCSPGRDSECSSDEEEINVEDDEPSLPLLQNDSPLDALMKMANKTFEGLETAESAGRYSFSTWEIGSLVSCGQNLILSEIMEVSCNILISVDIFFARGFINMGKEISEKELCRHGRYSWKNNPESFSKTLKMNFYVIRHYFFLILLLLF
jgi:homeobox protein LBX